MWAVSTENAVGRKGIWKNLHEWNWIKWTCSTFICLLQLLCPFVYVCHDYYYIVIVYKSMAAAAAATTSIEQAIYNNVKGIHVS